MISLVGYCVKCATRALKGAPVLDRLAATQIVRSADLADPNSLQQCFCFQILIKYFLDTVIQKIFF